MSKDSENDSVHEAHTAYAESQTDVVHIQLDIPRDVWARLTRWATARQIREAEAVVQLIKQQMTHPEDAQLTGFYADLIGRHLRGELEPGPRLLDIQVDEGIAKAIRQDLEKEYGTDDPIKAIELMRDRQ